MQNRGLCLFVYCCATNIEKQCSYVKTWARVNVYCVLLIKLYRNKAKIFRAEEL